MHPITELQMRVEKIIEKKFLKIAKLNNSEKRNFLSLCNESDKDIAEAFDQLIYLKEEQFQKEKEQGVTELQRAKLISKIIHMNLKYLNLKRNKIVNLETILPPKKNKHYFLINDEIEAKITKEIQRELRKKSG